MAVFPVGGVICLVISVNERDLCPLNHVKYDSYSITSQRERERPFTNTLITITVTFFRFSDKLQFQLQFLFTRNYN